MKTDLELNLEAFQGPLDLLLHLIEKNKVDIYDIPIVTITDQYIAYLERMQEHRLEVMSEFLVMAATLIAIKTRMLVPKHFEEEEDPRSELVQQLLEYRYFQQVAEGMAELEKHGYRALVKEQTLPEEVRKFEYKPDPEELFSGVELNALYATFLDLLQRMEDRIDVERSRFKEVHEDQWTITDRMEFLRDFLSVTGRGTFREVMERAQSKLQLVVTFLAMLEMMKIGEILVSQEETFGEIILMKKEQKELHDSVG